MRIFLAGATGVIGRRLALLLGEAGHEVTGTTRSAAKAPLLQALGVTPSVVDVFDAEALAHAVASAGPELIIHQLTDLPSAPGTAGYSAGQVANRHLRIEGTHNLMRAAAMAGVPRVVAQSIAFAYAPGDGLRSEDDPLDVTAQPPRKWTMEGILALERETLQTPGITGIVLRYGYLYGTGTWYAAPPKPPSIHVDAAAHAALLAATSGSGIYNIVENDGAVSGAKAVSELGFDSASRLSSQLAQKLARSA
jgi:nucleoside-diphosphate-sugar epimerase